MRIPARLVAVAFAALAVWAFGLAIWIDFRGEKIPGPVDVVWVDAVGPPSQSFPEIWNALGLVPGDRLRLTQRFEKGWTIRSANAPAQAPAESNTPSLDLLFASTLPDTKPIWICRADRGIPELSRKPTGANLAILPAIAETPEGWEFLGMELASMPRSGRPFLLRFTLGSVRGASGRVRIWVDGELVGEKTVSVFSPRENFETNIVVAKPGPRTIRLEALEGVASGRPRELVGMFEAMSAPSLQWMGESSHLSRWLESQGFVRRESGADLTILSRPFIAGEAEKLESAVRNGAGLLVLGGESWQPAPLLAGEALPSWLPGNLSAIPPQSGTPQENPGPAAGDLPSPPVLPPDSKPGKEIGNPTRETRESGVLALLFVFDKSGSMAGEKLEKTIEAVVATAKTLDPKDWLGILAFDREVKELLPLGPVGQSGDLQKKLENVDAGGGTRIFPALQRGAQLLVAAPASIRHLILLTDGATEDKVAKEAPYFEFMSEQASRGLTLTTVGIRGGDYDSEFLSNLALWGKGKFYPVDADRIPQIFTLEARRVRAEAGTVPAPSQAGAKREWIVRAKERHPILEGLDWEQPKPVPALRGLRALRPQPWASVPLQAGDDPLLAISHIGAGRAAVWASWGSGSAVADWMGDPRARQFWLQLAEYLRRRDAAQTLPIVLQNPGADLENRLRSREDAMRELGQMAAHCGGELLTEGDFGRFVAREPVSQTPAALPWIALLGALFSLGGMLLLVRESKSGV